MELENFLHDASDGSAFVGQEIVAFDELLDQLATNYCFNGTEILDESPTSNSIAAGGGSFPSFLEVGEIDIDIDSHSLAGSDDVSDELQMPTLEPELPFEALLKELESKSDEKGGGGEGEVVRQVQKPRKRPKPLLESGLSGSYWKIDQDEASSWSRPRRSKSNATLNASSASEETVEESVEMASDDPTWEVESPSREEERNEGMSLQLSAASKTYLKRKSERYKPKPPPVHSLRKSSKTPTPLPRHEDVSIITQSMACFAALALPATIIPTPHSTFLEKYNEGPREHLVQVVRAQQRGLKRRLSEPSSSPKPKGKAAAAKAVPKAPSPPKKSSEKSKLPTPPPLQKKPEASKTPAMSMSSTPPPIRPRPVELSAKPQLNVDRARVLDLPPPPRPPPILPPKENIPLRTQTMPKIFKKWEEDDIPEVIKVDNYHLMINNVMVTVNCTKCVTEDDVPIPMDPDRREPEDHVPQKLGQTCRQLAHCRLGCVCSSIATEVIERPHCGRPKCFFDCCCLFLNRPIGDDADIRSRLRPRVSLLNWKDFGRETAAADEDILRASLKGPANSKSQQQPNSSILSHRAKRNIQPPSRLRNPDFVMDDGKRASPGTGKAAALAKAERESLSKKINFSHDKSERENMQNISQQQGAAQRRQLISIRHPTTLKRTVAAGGVGLARRLPPRPTTQFVMTSKVMRRPEIITTKDGKPIISARYMHNHRLLRRLHKCRPCFIKLGGFPTNWPPKTPQVALKSTAKRSSHHFETRRAEWQLKQKAAQVAQAQAQAQSGANPLVVAETKDDHTFAIARENGTILTFLTWSSRKKCVPTAKKCVPGSTGKKSLYPWLKMPIPPEGLAWMFYELHKNFASKSHIMIPEMNIMIPTKVLALRLKEAEVHGKTLKLQLGDYLNTADLRRQDSIYIVKNLPNVLICGPIRKRKLVPIVDRVKIDALEYLDYQLKRFPDIEDVRMRFKFAAKIEPPRTSTQQSSSDKLITLDGNDRTFGSIPAAVMKQRYQEFKICVDPSHPSHPSNASQTHQHLEQVDYDLDSLCGRQQLLSAEQLLKELQDIHGTPEENIKSAYYRKFFLDEPDSESESEPEPDPIEPEPEVPFEASNELIEVDDSDESMEVTTNIQPLPQPPPVRRFFLSTRPTGVWSPPGGQAGCGAPTVLMRTTQPHIPGARTVRAVGGDPNLYYVLAPIRTVSN